MQNWHVQNAKRRLRRVPKDSGNQWSDAIQIHDPKLARLVQKALDAIKANDLVLALKYFGDCAAIDPTNRAVLYFGSEAAARAYFSLRFREDPAPPDKLNQWRNAALTLTEACHEAEPENPIALHNVGRFLDDDLCPGDAVEWYQRALKIKRDQVASWGNLGTCLYTLGDPQGAEVCWSKAVAFPAETPADHMTQGFIWLRRGDYLRGWKALNMRWEDQTFTDQYGRPDLGGKPWTGQPLKKGDTLFLHGEQGLGDHVQFARYIPELISRGIKVAGLETRPPLKRWMEACLPDVNVYVRDKDILPGFTYHAPLMSLPGLLSMEEVPEPLRPAITPMMNHALLAKWRDEEAPRRVGLIFKGTAGNAIDALRSIPDELLGQLANIPGVTWVPLQYDPSGNADLTARAWLGKNVEPTPSYTDVLSLAEVMAGLDSVVAVDTLGAHVAGSLDVPTLLLHRFNREWRWGQMSEETDWYPSVQMVTMPAPGDWPSVLGQVRARLASGRPTSGTRRASS